MLPSLLPDSNGAIIGMGERTGSYCFGDYSNWPNTTKVRITSNLISLRAGAIFSSLLCNRDYTWTDLIPADMGMDTLLSLPSWYCSWNRSSLSGDAFTDAWNRWIDAVFCLCVTDLDWLIRTGMDDGWLVQATCPRAIAVPCDWSIMDFYAEPWPQASDIVQTA